MDSAIIECVPNFSEGQRKEVIEEIAQAIGNTAGCSLLDVDPGHSTNRTVYTFVGSPACVVNGALNGARVAMQLIDMSQQKGEHPRLGALDVCPFIPVRDATMQDCVRCAEEFGERLAEELNVPVFLYGEAARNKERSTVPLIRAGEYEGLHEKFKTIAPDFGPREFLPQWGATMTGARKFLIAYNVNMLSTKEQAHRVALNIRTQGRGEHEPGRLTQIQAMGWYLDESNIAQVTVNLGDFEVTGIHTVFEEIKKDAEELNLTVCGSQVVGLVPLKSLLDAAEFYMKRDGLFILDDDQKIRLVVDKMGLSSLGLFTPKQRIIEYMIEDTNDEPLLTMSVRQFVDTVGSRCSAPGGGSVAALVATLGNALSTMVGFLSYGNRRYESLDKQMRTIIDTLYKGQKERCKFIDADTDAFNSFVSNSDEFMFYIDEEEETATKLPQKSDEEKALRFEAMQQGLKIAIETPKDLAITTNALWPTIEELATICNMNCKCDLQVALRCIQAGVYGAYYNVLTNLDNVKDLEYASSTRIEIEKQLEISNLNVDKVLKILEQRSIM